MDWGSIIGPAVGLLATIVGGFFARRIVTPSDRDRAALLAQIAADAAALIVSLNPRATWPDALRDLVNRISTAAGVPTKNVTAIENAAAAALMRLGMTPDHGR